MRTSLLNLYAAGSYARRKDGMQIAVNGPDNMNHTIKPRVPNGTRGLTLVEVLVALSVMLIGGLALVGVASHTMALSDANRTLKIAVFDAQSVVESISGAPFDEICNTTFPTPTLAAPRFPQGDVTARCHVNVPGELNPRVYVHYFPDAASQNAFLNLKESDYLAAPALPPWLPASGAVSLQTPPDPLRATVTIYYDTPETLSTSWTGKVRTRYQLPFMVTNLLGN